ncbi:MAG: hypothetical protein Q9164_007505, partial [Protoblastenia rupestris]
GNILLSVRKAQSFTGQPEKRYPPLKYRGSAGSVAGAAILCQQACHQWLLAPGITKTPIWTSENLAMTSAEDEWVLPEDVAEVMVALVEKTEISSCFGENAEQGETIKLSGGSVIEVTKGRLRDVQTLNDPGSLGAAGSTASGMAGLYEEVGGLLQVDGWGNAS